MAKILIADDDKTMVRSIKDWLQADRHHVEAVHDGSAAMNFLRTLPFDVVILDWNMPELSGIDVCKTYRASGGNAAIIMLTGMDQTQNKITGLEAGADDYLTKPFEIEELVTRIKALLRRSREFTRDVLKAGDVEMDVVARTVSRAGTEVHLKPLEFSLLEYFMRHPNEVFGAEALLMHVWPGDADASIDAVYVCINRIRRKLNDEGREGLIRNVHGVGYRFCPSKS